MKVNIVGLQYRNLPKDFASKLNSSSVSFTREHDNRHDKFAVKCICNGIHFGYIEKDKSEFISNVIISNNKINYKILKIDDFKVVLEIEPQLKSTHFKIPIPSNSDCSGVYRINFYAHGDSLSYIGQSTNIGKRIKSHQTDLNNGTHHNKKLQNGWLTNPTSFTVEVLYISPLELSPLEKQINLFEKEIEFIELQGGSQVNSIDGDIVFTNEAIKEFDKLNKEFSRIITKIRAVENHKKEKLGKLILDLGIIDRFKSRSQNIEVKDTNVVTWLNKKRHSPLDYIPKVRHEVKGSKIIIDAILNINKNLKGISSDNVFSDEFKNSLFKKRNSYDTCDISMLKRYMKTMSEYLNKDFSELDIKKYKTISNGRIEYDTSLLEIFDKSFLDSLAPLKE